MFFTMWSRLQVTQEDETGEIAAWVLILLMTSALVVGVWAVARDRLVDIVSTSLATVCGSIGC
jgi:hypothetical protein